MAPNKTVYRKSVDQRIFERLIGDGATGRRRADGAKKGEGATMRKGEKN